MKDFEPVPLDKIVNRVISDETITLEQRFKIISALYHNEYLMTKDGNYEEAAKGLEAAGELLTKNNTNNTLVKDR